jgi:4-carboxymuconolactone decarboxylase
MRLTPIAPADLTPEQRPLYDDMREGIAKSFKGFVAIRDDGALLGPWSPWLHEPSFGKASWYLVRAWPTSLRCRSRYGKSRSSSPVRISSRLTSSTPMCSSVSSVACRTRSLRPSSPDAPVDLTQDEAIAYDFASALVNGGVLPEPAGAHLQDRDRGLRPARRDRIVLPCRTYALVSIMLNTFDVPVPEA